MTYAPVSRPPVTVNCLIGRRDVMADVEGRPVSQDVLEFTFRRSDLPAGEPKRSARITYLGQYYYVTGTGEPDPDGLDVTVAAARS